MLKKSTSKSALMVALVTGNVIWGGTVVHAEEPNQAFTLDPMVVTAQRMETRDLDTPAAVSVITDKEISNSGAKTAYEIIERQVGFTNNAYGPGGREFGGSCSRTVLRGLDKGTLVMVNGAPINMLNYNSMEGIPAESIEKIEIVRGAQSVLYGSEAFGGAINIITKKGGKGKSTLTVGAGNYDKKWSINQQGDNYTIYLSKDYYGDVKKTNKVFEESTRLWSYRNSTKDNAFITFSPSDKLSFNVAHTKGRYYRDSWTLKNGEKTGAGTAYLYEDQRDNASMIYDDKENQFKSVLSYNRREINPYQGNITKFQFGKMNEATSSNWKMNTMTWDTQKGWNLRGDKDYLIAGISLQKDNMTDNFVNIGNKNDKVYVTKDADRKSASVYASYKYEFTPAFSTTIGARGQFIDDYAKDQNVFLPQLQTLLKVTDNISWYTNIGKSFQMPALNQYFSEGRTDALKPQEGWTYETGLKIINNKTSFKFGIYHMDIDGKFEWVDVGLPDKILMNAGKFKNTGVEVEYAQQITDKLNYKLGASLSNPKTQAYGASDYVQSDAKLQLTAGIDYVYGKLISNLNYLYLGKREDSYYNSFGVKGSDHSVPHRSLLNAAFTYKADECNSLVLNLNNIFDTKDTINKYENWGMPFNWMLTYNYSF